jgi:hypothetical protein
MRLCKLKIKLGISSKRANQNPKNLKMMNSKADYFL